MSHGDGEGYFMWTESCTDAKKAQAAVSYFSTNGYVVLQSFATRNETECLRTRASQIMNEFLESQQEASVFSTVDQTRQMDNEYFLSSASKISCFLEEALETRAVNKIGHALHDLDDKFAEFSRKDKVREAAEMVGYSGAVLVQSMYIVKGAHVGGKVGVHRDKTFVLGKDGGCLGYWWALEDANMENGCLWVVKGSHSDGRKFRRFVRNGAGVMSFEQEEEGENEGYMDGDFVPLEMKAGDLVMLDGGLVHKSEKNVSGRSRHAYSIHVVKGGVDDVCWLRREEGLPFLPL